MIVEIALIVMTFIQCLEFMWLYRSSRRTNEILENPAPVIIGLMDALQEDKKFAQEFGNFVAWCGAAGLSGIRQQMEQGGIKPPKIKSIGDFLGFLVQMPQIQQKLQAKAAQMLEGATDKGVDAVTEGFL